MEDDIKYPSRYKGDKKEKSLNTFIEKLKYMYKHGKLCEEEIVLCESIPGWKWENPKIKFTSKEEFIQWCKDNEIKTLRNFQKWCKDNKKPNNITANPRDVYENWSWGDLSGYYKNFNYISKDEFIQWCKDNEITSEMSKRKWCIENKKPDNIPSHPERIYNFSWKEIHNINDGKLGRKYFPIVKRDEFIQWCKDNEITSKTQFKNWCKKNRKPDRVPYNPRRKYENWSWKEIH